MPHSLLRLFRAAAVLEAFSWGALLIAMLFKHVVVHNEIGVRIIGPIHGGLFILYCLSVLLVREQLRWGGRTTLTGLLAGVPPFATIWFERLALRRAAAAAAVPEASPAGETVGAGR